MAKMSTRSSPTKNLDHNSPLKSQGLTKNPSLELCRFTDLEVDQLRSCFPDGTIFRPLILLPRVIVCQTHGSPSLQPLFK
ncbi:hypothetical protein Hanom_Chr11g01018261 [Helianthus anomalus]